MNEPAAEPKKVLVVEDDPWIRNLMADLLSGEGYAVVQAPDGRVGLEKAAVEDPDVILLDLAMPEKSGLPSAIRGTGADMLTVPSVFRGTPAVGYLIH